jgi:N,N'-diacetylchitobiose phosphorylase
MRYGYFDDSKREYVIDRVDVPVSWTNYLGVKDLCAVMSHNAGGYAFYKSAEHHRITRFRANGIPLDRPGHYVYLRDDDTGEYWSVSWQPVGKSLEEAKYECRHGLSYSRYSCDYKGIEAEQTLFIPIEDDVELWDVKLLNTSGRPRRLSVFGYVEFSFHHIEIDNQNLQMSLYASGSRYQDGVIEYDFFMSRGRFTTLRRTLSRTRGTRCGMGFWGRGEQRRIRLRWSRAGVGGARSWAGTTAGRCIRRSRLRRAKKGGWYSCWGWGRRRKGRRCERSIPLLRMWMRSLAH